MNFVTRSMLFTGLLLSSLVQAEENYYAKSKAYRIEGEPDPPSYVRLLSKTQFEQFRDVNWLDVGLDFRARYEYQENNYRITPMQPNGSIYRDAVDNVLLLRTRAYIGIHHILDPLRFAVEFQDGRSYNSLYETTNLDVNEFDLIQGYAELYFNDALGKDRPLSIRAGRQSFELLDRRLFANNQFRNTANNFEGFRVRLGKRENDWDLDLIGLQPVERLKYQFDRPDEDTWFYGSILSLKQWSKYVTIQPYFFGKKVNGDPYNPIVADRKNDADIYAPGLRVYGVIDQFDFDADLNKQFGRYGVTRTVKGKAQQKMLQHDAIAYSLEAGYTFKHDWKPRFSLFYGYGSGDKVPNSLASDGINQHFDAFYGFNQPWSRNDYFAWDNLSTPKVRIELTPRNDLKLDAGYGAFWLASDTDGWFRAGLRDVTAKSGSFIGQEFDIRLRHQLNPYIEWSTSYAHFLPGNFTRSQDNSSRIGPYTSQETNFFYFEISVNAFGDGNPK